MGLWNVDEVRALRMGIAVKHVFRSMMHMRTYKSLRSASDDNIGRLVTTSANKDTEASRAIVMNSSCDLLKKNVADVEQNKLPHGGHAALRRVSICMAELVT